ncbi:MAG: O-succinylbenzoic acid--CoA ligase [Bacteroidota bacterium]
MYIASKDYRLKLEDFVKNESIRGDASDISSRTHAQVKRWINGEETLIFKTSGSTGAPKTIKIDRQQILESTQSTFDFIDPKRLIRSSLLCLNPDLIGGAMVIFRALIMDLDLFIIEPRTEISPHLPPGFSTDLVSMVPMQFRALELEQIEKFTNILIGGAPMPVINPPVKESKIYVTYGMTETVSHIALRSIDTEDFHTTGDTQVAVASDGCLQFKGKMTSQSWLKTNDYGEVKSHSKFQWLGRKDFVINSGGIKIHPEKVEQKLSHTISSNYLITSVPDQKLGEKIVLVQEGDDEGQDFTVLDRYERPKNVFDNFKLIYTESGKIDRIKTRQKLIDMIYKKSNERAL